MTYGNPLFLRENPKGENESWEVWGERLAKKYPSPSVTPHLPPVPGYDQLRTSVFKPHRNPPTAPPLTSQLSLTADTWSEYGDQWRDHYNTHIAGKPIPTSGPTLPPLPAIGATSRDWAIWGESVSEVWNAYAAERGVDLPKALEGLKYPELVDNDWIAYSQQWEEYGNQVGERFKAALDAKSA